MKYDIFISYKRKSLPTANNLYYRLTTKGYSTFFDLEEMRRDNFDTQLLQYIENANDVFVILEEGSLDGCKKENWKEEDWFCHEIAFALEKNKNIIPILLNGYVMPQQKELPEELKELSLKNAPEFSFSFFDEYIEKLIFKEYITSKAVLQNAVTSIFKFYSNENCQIFKEGKLVCSLEGNSEEPFYLPVARKGSYRFKCRHETTKEEQLLKENIDIDEEKEIDITWNTNQISIEAVPKEFASISNRETEFCIKLENKIYIIDLVREIGTGSEGVVYEIKQIPEITEHKLCVKIFKKISESDRSSEKISFMIEHRPTCIEDCKFEIVWPITQVFDMDGRFRGYLMDEVSDSTISLKALLTPKLPLSLNDEWKNQYCRDNVCNIINRLKILYNISLAVEEVHKTGLYVLKDLNPRNILVHSSGKISLLDVDSSQIAENGEVKYIGNVCTKEYLPIEFYTRNVGKTPLQPITTNWDLFSMAVMFYQILIGVHPFVVFPYKNIGHEICDFVAESLFPFGQYRYKIKDYPVLHNSFFDLPKALQELFIITFSDCDSRPNTSDWKREILNINNSI